VASGIGARAAVVGCGHGATTITLARAFPASTFHGFDHRLALVEQARRAAAEAGVSERVTFEVVSVEAFRGRGYDLVGMVDRTRTGEVGEIPAVVVLEVRR
jgi:cyclopropane fatty-acyl-phospholipid synthase-like methyltransferase